MAVEVRIKDALQLGCGAVQLARVRVSDGPPVIDLGMPLRRQFELGWTTPYWA